MAEVFISYHEKSAGKLAEQIADALESAGISCWYARRDIPSGGDFARNIPPQIDACKVFLLILSKGVYQSKHIENELGLAFSRLNNRENITILPLEIGDFSRKEWIQYYLIHVQSIKIPSLDELSVQEITTRISNILGRESPQPSPNLEASAKITKSGFCGDKATYTLNEKGVLTVSGVGSMWNYDWNSKTGTANTPWWDERATISRIFVKCGITSIAKYAFCNCVNLVSVSIPNSVTKIEVGAFDTCTRLTKVIIPDGVTSIEVGVFNACVNLSSVTIPNSVKKIEFGAFSGCIGLTALVIPDSVAKIEIAAFKGCTNLNIASVAAKTRVNSFAFSESTAVIRRSK